MPRVALPFALSLSLLACASTAPLAPRAIELNRLGALALEQGDLASAEARLTLAIEFHPRFVEALVNLGLLELARGNDERASTFFQRALRINEHLPHPHHGLGALAHRRRRAAEAAAHYRDALRVDPVFAPSRANLARLLFEAGEYEAARAEFHRLIEAAPADGRGHGGLIESLKKLGRGADADEAIDRAARLAPETPQVRLLLARRALESGETDRARSALLALAHEHHEARASAHGWLSLVELARGDLGAARQHAQASIDLDRHDPVGTFAMAEALEAQGDPMAPAWRRRADELRQPRRAP